MTMHYCERWRRRVNPTAPWHEATAREAHDKGQVYTVLFGDLEYPDCVITLTHARCILEFFDSGHPLLEYQLQRQISGQLFLGHATVREWSIRSEFAASTRNYKFDQDGAILCVAYAGQVSKELAPAALWMGRATVDVSANWESFPEFGQYESIARRERGLIMPKDPGFYVLDPRIPAPRPDFVRAAPHSSSLYFTAKRDRGLDDNERRLVKAINEKFDVKERFEEYYKTGKGLNWVPLAIDSPDPAHPEAVLQGSVPLPTNTETAPVTGLEHWCAALTEFRRAIPDADWSVSLDDFEVPWNAAEQRYDPTPRPR